VSNVHSVTEEKPWRGTATRAFEAFDRVESIAAAALSPSLMAPVRRDVARLLRNNADLRRTPEPDLGSLDERVPACERFAEQFVVDVAGITDDDRSALLAAMGSESLMFVQTLFVVDVFQRARIALERLHATQYGPMLLPPEQGDLWVALEAFMRVVARSEALDPLTTELVRLRGAAVHNCRLCQSRLSVRAYDAAGDRSPFEAVDDYEHSTLTVRQKTALRLTDAVITQPALIDESLIGQVRAEFSTAESTEIILDVVRNAANKIAVAFSADAPVVTDGTEFFDTDETGEVVAHVDADIVRQSTSR
jgi:alkylhydroperoxidase family enzyme